MIVTRGRRGSFVAEPNGDSRRRVAEEALAESSTVAAHARSPAPCVTSQVTIYGWSAGVEGSERTVLACPTPSRKHSTNQAGT